MSDNDWTRGPDGRSNSSAEFVEACGLVERLIRESAFDLIGGRTHSVAVLVMAQLAHVQGLRPTPTCCGLPMGTHCENDR